MKKTYIFGHKNPDTDTITSSLVMEDFERKMADEGIFTKGALVDDCKNTQNI